MNFQEYERKCNVEWAGAPLVYMAVQTLQEAEFHTATPTVLLEAHHVPCVNVALAKRFGLVLKPAEQAATREHRVHLAAHNLMHTISDTVPFEEPEDRAAMQ
eukprot:2772742-Amphidinium_carterae.1